MTVFKFYSDEDFEVAADNAHDAEINTVDNTISVQDKCIAHKLADDFEQMNLACRIYND